MSRIEVYSSYPEIHTERDPRTFLTKVYGKTGYITLNNFATSVENSGGIRFTLFDPETIVTRLRETEIFLRDQYAISTELPIIVHYSGGIRLLNYEKAVQFAEAGNMVIRKLDELLQQAGCTGQVLGKGSLGHGLVADTTDVDIIAAVYKYANFSSDEADMILDDLARSLGLYKASVMYGFK
ncbi:MAG: hypothetical protein AAB893_02930 [Patescibacteria group bacterium]